MLQNPVVMISVSTIHGCVACRIPYLITVLEIYRSETHRIPYLITVLAIYGCETHRFQLQRSPYFLCCHFLFILAWKHPFPPPQTHNRTCQISTGNAGRVQQFNQNLLLLNGSANSFSLNNLLNLGRRYKKRKGDSSTFLMFPSLKLNVCVISPILFLIVYLLTFKHHVNSNRIRTLRKNRLQRNCTKSGK